MVRDLRLSDDMPPRPSGLTIAGFDPGTGAGITADLLTFAAFSLFATSAITALTVQTTMGVQRVAPVDPLLLRDTLDALESDLPAGGVKIGMLGGAAQVRTVATFLQRVRRVRTLTVVLDPVLVSSSGAELLDEEGLAVLLSELLPKVDAVTPNTLEAARLTGLPCSTAGEAEACAQALESRFPGLVVVITGGHLDPPDDLLWAAGKAEWWPGKRIQTRSTHGTGCAFSTAMLAARLGGAEWTAAALTAKRFVQQAMASAVPRGQGRGPMNLIRRPG